jgi:hypothetical protein
VGLSPLYFPIGDGDQGENHIIALALVRILTIAH